MCRERWIVSSISDPSSDDATDGDSESDDATDGDPESDDDSSSGSDSESNDEPGIGDITAQRRNDRASANNTYADLIARRNANAGNT